MENNKLEFMVSYHGSFQFRSWDHELSYIGGQTKLISVDRGTSFSNFVAKLSATSNSDFGKIKFHLPGEELDFLVSVTDDDDLQQMIIEHDHLQWPARLRIFLFPGMSRLSTYKNQGGYYDLLGLTEDQIQTTDQVNASLAARKALKLDGLVIVGGVTSNTDAAQLAETFAEANCSTKLLLLHPESDDSSQLSQIESEKLLAHLVETEMNKRTKEGTYTGKKFNAQGPFGSYFLAHATPSVRKEETRESDELTRLLAQKGECSLQIPKDEILKNEEIIKNSDLEVIRLLGKGDHGAIYRGKWKEADVCIKRVNITAIQDAEFRQEVEKLSKLSHPNVVAFYGEVPDNPGTIMTEFMVNYSLRNEESRKILGNRSDGELKKLIIASCAASAMEYLHSKDVIHKDLKTNNLLLNLKDHERPICKVGDFEFFNFKIKTRTEEEEMDSSIPWLAPEVLDGSSYEDPKKVDVFAFGVVLWEIFTLEEPYKNMNYHDVKVGVMNKSLRPPVSNEWNFELQNLMQECWAHDPSARPSFEEISRRLLLIKAEVEKMIKKKM